MDNLRSSNSEPKSGCTHYVRLSQSETTCCAEVHPPPSQSRRIKGAFQSEGSNEREGNTFLRREKSIAQCLTTVV